MLVGLETRGIGPAGRLALTCGERLTVLTGDNGLGKSLLLDLLWWLCARDWPEEPVVPRRDGAVVTVKPEIVGTLRGRRGTNVRSSYSYDPFSGSWRRTKIARPAIPGLTVYARIDGGFSLWDPARHYYWNAPSLGVDDPDRAPAFHLRRREVWYGKEITDSSGRELRVCNGLLHDWLEWESRDPAVFEAFRRVLLHLSPPGEPLVPAEKPVRLPGGDTRSIPALSSGWGGVVPLLHASAAIQRIVALAYFLVWAWREHLIQSELISQSPENQLIVIVDEIEAHLHPRWQRQMLPVLLTVADVLRSLSTGPDMRTQFIISTHSPLVLASLEEFFDEAKDKLYHLELRNGQVALEDMPWERRGDVNRWLTSDIFSLAQPRSGRAEQVVIAAEDMMAGRPENLPADLASADAIEAALQAVLPSLDAVWMRWRLFRQMTRDRGVS